MAEIITYPSELKTDQEKLFTLYPLADQFRVWRNARGKEYAGNGELRKKWHSYLVIYKQKVSPIFTEINRLRDTILRANYNKAAWSELSDADELKNTEGEKAKELKRLWGDRQVLRFEPCRVTSKLFDEFRAINISKLKAELSPDPYVDWTDGYTEVDTGSNITVAANKIEVAWMKKEEVSYVYKSYSPSFDDFEHIGKIVAGNFDTWGRVGVCMVSDAAYTHIGAAGNSAIGIFVTEDIRRIVLRDYPNETEDSYTAGGGTFYLVFARSGTAATCEVYDSTARPPDGSANLLDTLTETVLTDALEYLVFAFSDGTPGQSHTGNVDIEDWDLQEAAPPAGQQLFTLLNEMGY